MTIGTKSILFGVHQFAIHPWFVAMAWWKLHGFPWDPRLWVAFFVHDLGYIGKPNMDGPEGELHPLLGARIMHALFDGSGARDHRWECFTLFHSRFLAKKYGVPYSPLCTADKLATALMPAWLYLLLARLTGELHEYMDSEHARNPAGKRSPVQWLSDMQNYCEKWAYEHRDGKPDTWTQISATETSAPNPVLNTSPTIPPSTTLLDCDHEAWGMAAITATPMVALAYGVTYSVPDISLLVGILIGLWLSAWMVVLWAWLTRSYNR